MPQPTDARPRAIDAAFALVIGAAACAVVFAALLPLQIDDAVVRQSEAAAAAGVGLEALERQLTEFVVTQTIVLVLFAAVLVWSAFRIRAGRRRFRVVLIVLTVIAIAPLNGQALLVAALLLVADVLVFRRSSSAWMRAADAARAMRRARRRI